MRAKALLYATSLGIPRLPKPPLLRWMRVRRQRMQLAELSDHMLADIGLTRAEARAEAARPFWDLPPSP